MVTVADVHQQILLRVMHQARHQGPGAQKDVSAGPISPESSRISMLYACSPMGSTTSRLPWTAEPGTPCSRCSVLPHFLHTFGRMPQGMPLKDCMRRPFTASTTVCEKICTF